MKIVLKTANGKSVKTMHPSGMTMERWNHPFKSEAERVLVAKYFQRVKRETVLDLGEALV